MSLRTKIKPLGVDPKRGGNLDYGPFCFRIDTTNSDPTSAITYMDNNASYTPASMNFSTGQLDYGSWENAFFQPRPVMLKYDGTVDYELDHSDFTKKLSGGASDVSNTSYGGNCMIAWPQVWLKFTTSGNYQYVYIAAQQLDSGYRCYTHYNNNGTLLDEIYTAAFEPSNVSNKLRSLAGQTVLVNTAGTTMRQYAQANGNGWDFLDLGTLQMIQMLFILMFKSRDSQSKCGGGIVGASAVSSTTGLTKDKGMFYSTNNTSSSTTPVKFFGMENLWGNCYKWINGFKIYQRTIYYKLCNAKADGSTAFGYDPTSSSATGYKTLTTSAPTSATSVYNLAMPNTSDGLMWSPSASPAGSNSTYYCDQARFRGNASSADVGCALFGGFYSFAAYAGLFYVFLNFTYPLSNSNSSYGASLSCKPL